jgi:hypothetical protein
MAEAKARISRQVETCPLSFQRVELSAIGTEAEHEVRWKLYSPEREKMTTTTKRREIARVCTLSRRLIAIERARALGRKPVDHRALALELEARRWAEERDKRELR